MKHIVDTEVNPAEVGFEISVGTSISDFDALEQEWKALHEEHGISVFQSFEYQRTWWKHFGENHPQRQLHIVIVREHNRLVAIAPFYVERLRLLGFLTFRRLAFLGREISDYLDVVVARGYESTSTEVIAAHLADNGLLGDVIVLEDITERSSTLGPLYEALLRHGFRGARFISEQCPRTQLLHDWEATLSSFHIDHRREIRRRRRNICKNYEVEFEIPRTENDVRVDLDEFIAMHQYRWTTSGHKGVFADSRATALHREIADLFQKRGWLFLGFLRVNGKRIAANYCFRFRNELSVFLTGMADAGVAAKYSPGRVLTAYCMEEAVNQGLNVYDFMRGTEHYKYEFDGVDVPNSTLSMYRPGSSFVPFEFKLHVLITKFCSRASREWIVWRMIVREHGLISSTTGRRIFKRIFAVFKDGVAQIRTVRRASVAERKPGSKA